LQCCRARHDSRLPTIRIDHPNFRCSDLIVLADALQ
jgi:hypothetical protein